MSSKAKLALAMAAGAAAVCHVSGRAFAANSAVAPWPSRAAPAPTATNARIAKNEKQKRLPPEW